MTNSPRGYISMQDVIHEIKDWIIIGIPFLVANQDMVTKLSNQYLNIPPDILAFIFTFIFFLKKRMDDGKE